MSDKPDNFRPAIDKATQRASHEPRPQVSFVVEKENGKNHRYVCGHCGAPLFHRGTTKVLDCVFLCPHCNAINEAPT
jgi:ribosomal protein L37AE/L43A